MHVWKSGQKPVRARALAVGPENGTPRCQRSAKSQQRVRSSFTYRFHLVGRPLWMRRLALFSKHGVLSTLHFLFLRKEPVLVVR